MNFLPKLTDKYNEQKLDFRGNTNLETNLYYLKKQTSKLVEYNIDEKTEKTYDMNIYENEEALPYSCQIPRGKLFYIIAEKSTLDTKKSFFILYLIKKYKKIQFVWLSRLAFYSYIFIKYS